MTATIDETTDLHADGMPNVVVTKTASSSEAPAAEVATLASDAVRPAKDWFSGYCNGGAIGQKCADGQETNKVGEPLVRCLYLGHNGEKAPTPIVYCACECHDRSRAKDDPNFGIQRKTETKKSSKAKKATAPVQPPA